MIFNSSIKLGVWLISLATIAVTLPACIQGQATNSNTTTAGAVKIDGSSTVYPITVAIAKEYVKTKGGNSKIDVKFSGTTGGFKKFCAGETDISNASRPILSEEVDRCVKAGIGFIELPVAFDALTIVVNPQNTWVNDLTMAELKKMWEPSAQGKIKNWNQIRASFPDKPLKLFGAGNQSGTFDYFNEVTSGNPKASRTDYSGSENDNDTVKGVEKDAGALGYFGLAYYEADAKHLKAVAIDSGKGPVSPSRETVEKATYQPFSRPLFIYVNALSAQRNPEVKAFVEYYLAQANQISKTVGYVPLPEAAYRLANIQFIRGKVGTVFDGVPQPDVTIAELLRRQAKFGLTETAIDAKK